VGDLKPLGFPLAAGWMGRWGKGWASLRRDERWGTTARARWRWTVVVVVVVTREICSLSIAPQRPAPFPRRDAIWVRCGAVVVDRLWESAGNLWRSVWATSARRPANFANGRVGTSTAGRRRRAGQPSRPSIPRGRLPDGCHAAPCHRNGNFA
jgi:hypothetical protein